MPHRFSHPTHIFSHSTYRWHILTPYILHILSNPTHRTYSLSYPIYRTCSHTLHILTPYKLLRTYSHTLRLLASLANESCSAALPYHTTHLLSHPTYHMHTHSHTLHWLVAVAGLRVHAHTLTPYIPFRHTYSHTLHIFPNTDSHTPLPWPAAERCCATLPNFLTDIISHPTHHMAPHKFSHPTHRCIDLRPKGAVLHFFFVLFLARCKHDFKLFAPQL